MIILAILLPPLALLVGGHPFQALLCLLLWATMIGWPLAAFWAVAVINNDRQERRYRELVRRAMAGQR
jgi:hypothetical protein